MRNRFHMDTVEEQEVLDAALFDRLQTAFAENGTSFHKAKTGHFVVEGNGRRIIFCDCDGVMKFAQQWGILTRERSANGA